MQTFGVMLASGVEAELPISQREANIIKEGFRKGEPFEFLDDSGSWFWFDPEKFAMVAIENE